MLLLNKLVADIVCFFVSMLLGSTCQSDKDQIYSWREVLALYPSSWYLKNPESATT